METANLLVRFIESKTKTPFQWGVNDCCIFSSDWILMFKGEDPAAGIRGAYSSALGAARILKACGGVEQIARDYCTAKGWREVAPTLAMRGDVMSYATDTGPALGVCCGLYSAFVGKRGVEYVRTLKCAAAWRVE